MTRAIKAKDARRVRERDLRQLEQAVNYNYDMAVTLKRAFVDEMWQRFWANVAIAALLAHFEREAPNAWPELVKATQCWEPDGASRLQIAGK